MTILTRRRLKRLPDSVAAEVRQSGCEGKAPLSPEQARRIAKRARKPLDTYRCPICGRWHVGGLK